MTEAAGVNGVIGNPGDAVQLAPSNLANLPLFISRLCGQLWEDLQAWKKAARKLKDLAASAVSWSSASSLRSSPQQQTPLKPIKNCNHISRSPRIPAQI